MFRPAFRTVHRGMVALLAFAGPCAGMEATALPPGDPTVAAALPLPLTVSGLVEPMPGPSGGFAHDWPGVVASARFEGDSVLAVFDDPNGRFLLSVDGAPGAEVTRPGRGAWRISGLGSGPHTITLAKLSESAGAFGGFAVPPGGAPLPPPPPAARRIEVIGDSDAVGYGVAAAGRDCDGAEVFAATDTRQTFGPRVAAHFGADLRLIARSGIGIVRNYGGSPGPGMPQAYDAARRPGDGWTPQVVVLALGSNDFAVDLAPGEPWADADALRADFEATLAAFLAALRDRRPDALLLVVRYEDYGGDYAAATAAAVAARRAAGDGLIDQASFPKLERTACDWHPSLEDHRVMAERLIAYLDARPGVWREH